MELREAVDRALQLEKPWAVTSAELFEEDGIVEIHVGYDSRKGPCPACGEQSKRHDAKVRRWRHLDLLQYQSWVVCKVPRVRCEEHGVKQIDVPWGDGYARFTAQFECMVIDWLKVSSMTATARNLGLSWDQVSGIQERAVQRGLARREEITPSRIGVDETSFQKRHEYVTIVTDLGDSRVLYVADGRGRASIDGFFEGLSEKQIRGIDFVAMDMHLPFIYSAGWHLPRAVDKICFDRFHVAQLFSKAVDQTRRAESKRLAAQNDDSLKRTRYLWLQSVKSMPRKMRRKLSDLLETSLLVGKVWAIKETASNLWKYKSKTWAEKAWIALSKAARAIDAPALQKAIDTVLRHLFGIVNAIVNGVSNASSESINSRVQALKKRANGYSNRARFRDAILFHLGGLDLYPATRIPHTSQ